MTTPLETTYDEVELIVFDVNETLSDMTPLQGLWQEAGVPAHLAQLWFTEVLRDGFALAATLQGAPCAAIARDAARRLLASAGATDVDGSAERIMDGFVHLDVHPDVVEGVRALVGLGIRLVTLSNGGTAVADQLLTRAGVLPAFEALLSVEAVGCWKPALQPYQYALDTCSLTPGQAMMVAVHPWDIHGAAAAGMRTAWIARTEEPYPRYFTAPDIIANSLTDLAGKLTLSHGEAPLP